MKTKHTKGPWHVNSGMVESSTSQPIARAYRDMSDFKHNIEPIYPVERDANIKLIAAAPEMLEALEHIQRELCQGEFVKHSKDAIRKIQDAIAKAGGEV